MNRIVRIISKRGLALFLALMMCITMLPVTAFAAEDETDPQQTAAAASVTVNNGGEDVTTNYPSLQEAVSAADSGALVTMLEDYTEGMPILVKDAQELTLDLNGKLLAPNQTFTNKTTYVYGIYVQNSAKLTIVDNGASKGKIAPVMPVNPQKRCYGTIGITVMNNAQLIVDGITVEASAFGITGNGSKPQEEATSITVRDCNVTGDNTGIYHPQSGVLNVQGGGVITGYTGIEMRGGTLNVEENATVEIVGNYTVDGTYYGFGAGPNSGPTTFGAGVAAVPYQSGKGVTINIAGGTIKGWFSLYENSLSTPAGEIAMNVTGGSFQVFKPSETVAADPYRGEGSGKAGYNATNEGYSATSIKSVETKSFVSGGTFTDIAAEYCSEGSVPVKVGGSYVVKDAASAGKVASVKTLGGTIEAPTEEVKYYDTLQEAIDNAGNGTVTLLKDTVESITIDEGKTITLELNGCVLTNKEGEHTITNYGTLAIVGEGTVDNVSHGKAVLLNNGTANLHSGTYTRSREAGKNNKDSGGNSYYFFENRGDLTLGSVYAYSTGGYSSMVRNGVLNTKDPSKNIAATLTVNHATLINGNTAIKNENGKVIVNGGEIASLTHGYSVVNYDQVELREGDYTKSGKYAIYHDNSANPEAKVTISGGTFASDNVKPYCEEGSVPILGADGKYVIAKLDDTNSVASVRIGETVKYYTTLQSAIDNADGGEVSLLRNATESITIPEGKTVTLDLLNYTLTGVKNAEGAMSDVVTNRGTLTVKASFNGGTILGGADKDPSGNDKTGRKGIALVNEIGAVCTIESGTIMRGDDNTFGNYTIQNKGEMYIKGGEITNNSNKSNLVVNFNNQGSNDFGGVEGVYMEIAGGYLHQDSMGALKNDPGCTMKIKGGKIERSVGEGNYACTFYGDVTIEGGEISTAGYIGFFAHVNANGEEFPGSFTVKDGAKLNCNQIRVVNNISGGTTQDPPTLTITGGEITANEIYQRWGSGSTTEDCANVDISGGTFSKDVSRYCIDDYAPTLANGKYVVLPVGKLAALNDGGVVDGNTVTYGAETTVDFTKDGNDEGRAPNHWWTGFEMTLPGTVSEKAQYHKKMPWDEDFDEAKLWSANSDHTFWAPVDQSYIDKFGTDGVLTFVYEFDWNGDGEYDQTVEMIVNDEIQYNGVDQLPGTVTALNEGGVVDGNTVTYGAETAVDFTKDGNDEGRAPNHWWTGFKMTAPTSVSKTAKYRSKMPWTEDFAAAKDWSANSDGTFWAPVDQSYIDKFGTDGVLTFVYEFDWNGDGEYDQTVEMIVNDEIQYNGVDQLPGTVTALNKGGVVDGNTVTYGAETTVDFTKDGNDEGRAPNHWWTGFKMTAPTSVSKTAKYQSKMPWQDSFGAVKDWSANSDGTFWAPVDQAYIDKYGEDGVLTFTYQFDWNGDGIYDQTVEMVVNDGIQLKVSDLKVTATPETVEGEGDVTITVEPAGASGATVSCTDTENNAVEVTGEKGAYIVSLPNPDENKTYTYTITVKVGISETSTAVTVAHKHISGESERKNVVPATCSAKGSYEEVTKCSVCDEELSRETKMLEIDPEAHPADAIEHFDEVPANCTEIGHTAGTRCTACSTVLSGNEEISALGHDMVEDAAVAPTCTTPGLTAGEHCSRCDDVTVAREVVSINPNAHPADAIEHFDEVPATCTETGHTAGTRCTECDTILSGNEEIPMIDHTSGEPVRENVVPATCSAEGSYDEVVYCSVCNKELSRDQKTINKIAHTSGEESEENRTEATCSAEGGYDVVVRCTECGEIMSSDHKTIEKLAHTPGEPVHENEVPAQPGVAGSYDEVIYCTVCNTEIRRTPQTIAPLPSGGGEGGGEGGGVVILPPDPPTPLGLPLPFIDVKEENKELGTTGDWFAPYVRYMYEHKDSKTDNSLMDGVTPVTFSPNSFITRGQLVTILWRIDGCPETALSSFTDVGADQFYAEAIGWGSANGIVKGYSETIFKPRKEVSREEAAAILYRYAQYKGYDVSASADLSKYSDRSSVADWFVTEMQWANAVDMISGRSETILAPKDTAKRCEAAKILMQFCEQYNIFPETTEE